MKNSVKLLCIVILITSCRVSKIAKQDFRIVELQTVLDSIYQVNPNAKGIMVHVESPKQKISWSGAAGYSDYEKKAAIQANQPALIASTVKIYVSASILRLVEDGKLSIDKAIGNYLTSKTAALFVADNYNLQDIKVKHLLSHTSGIQDYINPNHVQIYLDKVKDNPKHRWTRDEQLALTVEVGDKLAAPGEVFNYADANFLLLTEIIESITKKPFYQAMRILLKYEDFDLDDTWFYTLENHPKGTGQLVHQYQTSQGLNSYEIDPSFDLYGGGGIACTTEDLAKFCQYFFSGRIVEDNKIRDLIYTSFPTKKNDNTNYFLGLQKGNINGLTTYGHGGFWGTVVQYIPELDASVSVYILERDERSLRKDVLEEMISVLQGVN